MKKSLMALFFGTALILGACGDGEITEPPQVEAPDNGNSAIDAERIVNQRCISCHGENLEGRGNFPELNEVGSRLSEEEILAVILEGRGSMPPRIIEGEEAEAVAAWLADKE